MNKKDSDDEDEDDEGGAKWKTLEHHGVIFFAAYQAHGIKILNKVKTTT